MVKRNSHCSFCGHPFPQDQAWPRTCSNCQRTTYLNPLPVAVILLPVDDGLLLIRREVEPGKGMLALPGGYIGMGETWQEAGAREVMEETGITLDPAHIQDFRVLSAPDHTLLIFGLAAPTTSAQLPPFQPTAETAESVIISTPTPLAFTLHEQVVHQYFTQSKRL